LMRHSRSQHLGPTIEQPSSTLDQHRRLRPDLRTGGDSFAPPVRARVIDSCFDFNRF
jgi:hypothetical protein